MLKLIDCIGYLCRSQSGVWANTHDGEISHRVPVSIKIQYTNTTLSWGWVAHGLLYIR